MINVQDYLDRLPMGEAVCNRRVLAAMKRKGLISDYSQWGYLESQRLWYVRWGCFGRKVTDTYHTYFGRIPTCYENGSINKPFATVEEMLEALPDGAGNGFHYRGHYFTTRYFDGCFKPYLVKAACA